MLLAFFLQTLPPVPRQTVKNPARGTSDSTDERNANKSVPVPAPVQNTEHSISAEGNNSNVAAEDKQGHVIVDRLPGKDWWDKFYIGLTFALVIIGTLTLGAIWFQAKKTAEAAKAAADSVAAINSQSGIMQQQALASAIAASAAQRSADAAKISADALIASERAWLMVEIEPQSAAGVITDGVTGDVYRTTAFVTCISTNQGKTPAWIMEVKAGLIMLGSIAFLPKDPDLSTIKTVVSIPKPVQASGIATCNFDVTCQVRRNQETVMVIYGLVKYRLNLSDKEVDTTFGYVINRSEKLVRLPTEYAAYNKNT